MLDLFTKHPNSVGENYFQHLASALTFAVTMLVGVVVCIVHAVLPFLFEKTGSQIIQRLHDGMVRHRVRQGALNSELN